MDDRQLIDKTISYYTSYGWQVLSQSDSSIQIRKPKAWSMLLLVGGLVVILFGLVLPPFFVIGIGLLILAVIDHFIRPEKILHVTLDQIKDNTAPGGADKPNWLLIGLGIFAISICSFALYYT